MQCQTYCVLVAHPAYLALRVFANFLDCNKMVKMIKLGTPTVVLAVVKVFFHVGVKLNKAHFAACSPNKNYKPIPTL